MAVPNFSKPFGLRDVKIAKLTGAAETVGTLVDLPAARTLSFEPQADSQTLEGDDSTVSIRNNPETITWDLESGGIALDAWAVMSGGTIATTGTAPSQITRLHRVSADLRPYFTMMGQSIGDAGDDVQVRLWKCKCTDGPHGEFSNGNFYLTQASGEAVADVDDNLYTVIINETSAPIALVSFE